MKGRYEASLDYMFHRIFNESCIDQLPYQARTIFDSQTDCARAILRDSLIRQLWYSSDSDVVLPVNDAAFFSAEE